MYSESETEKLAAEYMEKGRTAFFSKELNKIGFDTETYNSKIDNINETVELLKKRVNENEIVIDQLKKRIEKLENKK